MNILRKNKYWHLSIINKYPKGIPNRFQNTADKWVRSLNHPHVKTYYQFFLNVQTGKHQVKLYQTEEQELHSKQVTQKDRPGVNKLVQIHTIFYPQRVNDKITAIDTKDMTLWKFIKEAIKQRKQHHKFPFYVIVFVAVQIFFYIKFIHGKELSQIGQLQKIKVTNPQVLQIYQFQQEQKNIKQIKQRINIVNDQLLNKLSLATSQS